MTLIDAFNPDNPCSIIQEHLEMSLPPVDEFMRRVQNDEQLRKLTSISEKVTDELDFDPFAMKNVQKYERPRSNLEMMDFFKKMLTQI